jgi:hypothetical protein
MYPTGERELKRRAGTWIQSYHRKKGFENSAAYAECLRVVFIPGKMGRTMIVNCLQLLLPDNQRR